MREERRRERGEEEKRARERREKEERRRKRRRGEPVCFFLHFLQHDTMLAPPSMVDLEHWINAFR